MKKYDNPNSSHATAQQRFGAQKLSVGVRIDGAVVDQIFALLQAQRHAQRGGDGTGDVFLDRENVRELTIVIIGPDAGAVISPDQLHRDAHAVAGLTHRPFDEMRRTELLADRPDVAVLTLELEGRGTGDH